MPGMYSRLRRVREVPVRLLEAWWAFTADWTPLPPPEGLDDLERAERICTCGADSDAHEGWCSNSVAYRAREVGEGLHSLWWAVAMQARRTPLSDDLLRIHEGLAGVIRRYPRRG